MEVTIQMGDATLWDALSAVGTLLAVLTAVGIAVSDRHRMAMDGAARGHSAVRLAERMAILAHQLIEGCETASAGDGRLSSHRCDGILRSGPTQELLSGFSELRPADLPNEMAAQAYIGVRMNARDLIGLLERYASTPGSALHFNSERFYKVNGQHWATLQDAVSRYSRGPISIQKWARIRARREKEVLAAVKRDHQKASLTPSKASRGAPAGP